MPGPSIPSTWRTPSVLAMRCSRRTLAPHTCLVACSAARLLPSRRRVLSPARVADRHPRCRLLHLRPGPDHVADLVPSLGSGVRSRPASFPCPSRSLPPLPLPRPHHCLAAPATSCHRPWPLAPPYSMPLHRTASSCRRPCPCRTSACSPLRAALTAPTCPCDTSPACRTCARYGSTLRCARCTQA